MSEHDNTAVSRRRILTGGAAAAAMLATGTAGANQGNAQAGRGGRTGGFRRQRTPVGVQLYSVRNDCARDLPGTLEAIGKMGYQGVEFAGYYGRTAAQLKKLLDDNGLQCCGTHTAIDTLLGDELDKTIEFNKTIGNKYLIVPGLSGKYTSSISAWAETGKLFKELAARAKDQDMRVGYHNHTAEFKPIDGQLPWETFLDNSGPDVIMQLDVGNAMHSGLDPIPYVYRYPGRAVTVHVKEFSKTKNNAMVGEGDVPWRAFFALCRAVGDTEWYIVEQESYDGPPVDCIRRCLDNLREMRLVG